MEKKKLSISLTTQILIATVGGIVVNDFMSCHQTAHTNCHQIA